MSTQAIARLQKELKDLSKNPVEGFKVEIPDDTNLFKWVVYIQGPSGSLYENGIFKAEMNFPEDYPNAPPSMKFISEFWHPNIYPDGRVCISILHTPDPMNTDERPEETWRPILTVESILVSVCSMFSDPNFSSPANIDASVEMRNTPEIFKKRAKACVERSLNNLPPGFEMPKPKKPVVQEVMDFDPFDQDDDDFGQDDDDDIEDDEEEPEEDE
ncbi:hypothetical protein PROFUN_08666 [Planoprotostelium fungivorum]|uniref:UBC core domain-containing protein n=1 Tax=Planoprotostelium fungivorum TaxID=1890364 RepID=A0A2P6NJ68_9EUKA|nr:hypothetical protein PROFUN_08666 [Planoprotostelium fungivorum]